MEEKSSEQQGKDRQWLDEAEEALRRTGDALRAAWGATREARMNALESAKLATRQLGEAIDKGVETARNRWSREGGTADEEE